VTDEQYPRGIAIGFKIKYDLLVYIKKIDKALSFYKFKGVNGLT
jgi:hypothetical protein